MIVGNVAVIQVASAIGDVCVGVVGAALLCGVFVVGGLDAGMR